MTYPVMKTVAELEREGAILQIQDGNHGASHPKSGEFVNDGIPFLMASDISADGLINFHGCARLSPDRTAKLRIGFAHTNDVLLTHKGTVGHVTWLRNADPYVMLTPQVTYYRVNDDKLLPRYLVYALRTSAVQHQLNSLSAQSTRPYISITTQRHLLIPYFPSAMQRKIADILSAYDDLIEANTRRITILERIASCLFVEWFVNPRLSDPKWLIKSSSEIMEFDPPTKVPREGQKPFIPMMSLSTNTMVISDIETRAGNSGSKFQAGDTLLARITPCLENGKTGYVGFLENGQVGFGSTEFVVMRGRSVSPEWVYLFARSELFRSHAIKSMSGATGRQRVRRESLEALPIPEPDAETMRIFTDIVRPMFREIHVLARAYDNLRYTRDLLLPKLISGEIDSSGAEQQVEPVPDQVAAE